ncbi:MAG: very short patch repair endonuclease [Burkholderiales bacterium]|nr:very short patch repair endonuclease [Burkholderiales bacterium]
MTDDRAKKGKQTIRLHRGDIMSPEKRSALMARIRGKGTKPEVAIGEALRQAGLDFETHAGDLPGRPDFVFREVRVAVFVDGDFWHGYRFQVWRLKLSEKWEKKIATTIRRDRANRKALREAGWRVLRFWEHEVEASNVRCAARVARLVNQGKF